MIYHKVVLEDGTELSSDVIMSVTFEDSVNSDTDISPGSCCVNSTTISFWTGEVSVQLAVGDTFQLWRYNDGYVELLGTFVAEQPTKTSANVYSVVSYDYISKTEVIISDWLATVTFPITMENLLIALVSEMGLELGEYVLPNGSYKVQSFYADSLTGRQILQWIAEANALYCFADGYGKIAFGWYKHRSDVTVGVSDLSGLRQLWVGTDGILLTLEEELFELDEGVVQYGYTQDSLLYEDYSTALIEKVQINQSDSDVGVIYPDSSTATNTLVITSNYLLLTETTSNLSVVAENIYNALKTMTYVPCSATLPAGCTIRAGDVVTVTDSTGTEFNTYVTSVRHTSSGAALESTGSSSRESVTATNTSSYTNLTGRVLNIQTSVEGLQVKAEDLSGKYTQLDLDVDGISLIVDPIGDAVAASKLTFDATYGLTVTNGGIRILNTSGMQVFGVDSSGYLELVGSIKGASLTLYDYAKNVNYLRVYTAEYTSTNTTPWFRMYRTATTSGGQGTESLSILNSVYGHPQFAMLSDSGVTTYYVGVDTSGNAEQTLRNVDGIAMYSLSSSSSGNPSMYLRNSDGYGIFSIASDANGTPSMTIKNGSNVTTLWYTHSNSQPYFNLNNASGGNVFHFYGDTNGNPNLYLKNKNGYNFFALISDSNQNPSFSMANSSNVSVLDFLCSSTGTPSLYIRNTSGVSTLSYTHSSNQPYFTISNASGAAMFYLYGDTNGNPNLYLKNKNGYNIYSIASDTNGNPSIGMVNSAGTSLLGLSWSSTEWLPSLSLYTGNTNVRTPVISLTSSYYGTGTQLILSSVYGKTFAVFRSTDASTASTGNYHDLYTTGTTTEQRWWQGEGTQSAYMKVDSTGSELWVNRLYVNGTQIT